MPVYAANLFSRSLGIRSPIHRNRAEQSPGSDGKSAADKVSFFESTISPLKKAAECNTRQSEHFLHK